MPRGIPQKITTSTPAKIPTVKAEYKPRKWAREFHDAPQRYKVLVLHRRAGKTTACINHLIRDALLNENSRYAYIAPYYKQAKQVAWDMLKQFSRVIPGISINESELRVDYPNGARIQLFGADNPDALRGLGLWGVIFDEYSQQPSSIFTEVIRPALSDHEGYAIWIGTPKGRNDFYRLYEENRGNENWFCQLLRASESGIIKKEELEDARKMMLPDEYNQEYECSFDAAIKGAYYSHQLQEARQQQRITQVNYNKELPVETYWDLGMSDTTCIIFVQRVGREIHIVDYYENNGLSLEDYAIVLRKKPYRYSGHYLPHDIKVRELGTGRSRYELLGQHLGRDSLFVVPNIPIKDGIDAGRKIFSKCWFDDEKCASLVDALAAYAQEWDEKKGIFRDKPRHDWASHPADAFRMLAVGFKDTIERKQRPVRSKYNSKPSDTIRKQIGVKSKYNYQF